MKTYDTRGDRTTLWDAEAYDAARRARGLTWLSLSRRTGIPLSTLHNYATGALPPRGRVRAIAKALRVPQKLLGAR
jgi:lambda repressor-like predicted transcriptional regulator